jgi:hypothetical protein
MIGAENNVLATEARETIFDIAGLSDVETEQGIYEFEKETYKWAFSRGVGGSFTYDLMDDKSPQASDMNQKRKEILTKLELWLFERPLRK